MALRSSGTDAQFLRNMQCGCNYEKLSAVGHINLGLLQSFEKDGGEQCFLDFMVRNFQYATHHRRRMLPSVEDIFANEDKDTLPYSERDAKDAVMQRFWLEQAGRTQNVLNELSKQYGVPIPEGCHSILGYMDYVDYGHDQRKRNASWHVNCFSDADRKRVKKVLKDFRVKNYTMHAMIDDCIADFAL